MNIVRELRRKKGIQQKELAIIVGVAQPTVSEWESGKKDPSGERLKKLAEYFGVDELVILGKGVIDLSSDHTPTVFPKQDGKTETEQIAEYLLQKLGSEYAPKPKTVEARILAKGMDQLPQEQRERALNMMNALYPGLFEKGDTDDT